LEGVMVSVVGAITWLISVLTGNGAAVSNLVVIIVFRACG
jgi:hypothetical protein